MMFLDSQQCLNFTASSTCLSPAGQNSQLLFHSYNGMASMNIKPSLATRYFILLGLRKMWWDDTQKDPMICPVTWRLHTRLGHLWLWLIYGCYLVAYLWKIPQLQSLRSLPQPTNFSIKASLERHIKYHPKSSFRALNNLVSSVMDGISQQSPEKSPEITSVHLKVTPLFAWCILSRSSL